VKLLFIFVLLFHYTSSAGAVYNAYQSSDLEEIFYSIWDAKKKERVDFAHANVQIILHQGFYKIEADDLWAEELLYRIRPTRIFKSYLSYLQLIGRHSTGTKELIAEGSFEKVLLFLNTEARKGLKVSGELCYEAFKEVDFALSLQQAAYNNSDTVIRLRFCETENCVKDAELKRKIKKIYMIKDDGMSLIIHSKYNSLEMQKREFFSRGFYPFIQD
jgi:hypothetical protein